MAIPKVYVETSVISYLTAKPSRDLIVAAHQQVTRDWWSHRKRFELFVSDAVLEEAKRGDKAAAARRKVALEGISVLSATALAQTLAADFLRAAVMPSNAAIVTWNCTHIANAIVRAKIETVCRKAGFRPPVICTPLELSEEE